MIVRDTEVETGVGPGREIVWSITPVVLVVPVSSAGFAAALRASGVDPEDLLLPLLTGEATDEERRAVAEAVIEATGGRVRPAILSWPGREPSLGWVCTWTGLPVEIRCYGTV